MLGVQRACNIVAALASVGGGLGADGSQLGRELVGEHLWPEPAEGRRVAVSVRVAGSPLWPAGPRGRP
jgi:hypothetical protein